MVVCSFRKSSWSIKSNYDKFQLQTNLKEYLSNLKEYLPNQLLMRNFGLDFRERKTKFSWESGDYFSFPFKRNSFTPEDYNDNCYFGLCLFSQHLILQAGKVRYMASNSKKQIENISNQMEGTNISSILVRPLRRMTNDEYEKWSDTEEGRKCLAELGQVDLMEATTCQSSVLEGVGIQSNDVMIDLNIDAGNRKRLRNEELTEGDEIRSKDQEDEIMVNTNSNVPAELGIMLQQ